MEKEIKLEIPAYSDRQKIVAALANSGYSVKVKIEGGEWSWQKKYFVIFTID